jgi:prepilin-type N-terminal cleavage/methylation domain-containing protein
LAEQITLRRSGRRGVTLIEMMVVVTLVAIMVGISFPALTAGVDSIRLASASDAIVSLLDGALNRAERRQQVMEVTILRNSGTITLASVDPTFHREMTLPDGVKITRVLPEYPGEAEGAPRRILLHPGGTVPRIGIEIQNRRGMRRIVRVDPITGVPIVERL